MILNLHPIKGEVQLCDVNGHITKNFSDVNTPAPFVQEGKNLKFGLKWNEHFGKQKRADFIKGQEIVDSECLRYMDKLTPMRTGMMIKSATLGTVIGSGEINYLAPYARRQYYNNSGCAGEPPELLYKVCK